MNPAGIERNLAVNRQDAQAALRRLLRLLRLTPARCWSTSTARRLLTVLPRGSDRSNTQTMITVTVGA